MFKVISRPILLAATLFALLLPARTLAQQSETYIALDTASMRPLAGVLASAAELSGAHISVLDIADRGEVFYEGDAAGLNLEAHKMANQDAQPKLICNFLNGVGKRMNFSADRVDLYVLCGYARNELAYGAWQEDEQNFGHKDLGKTYPALCELMDEHPQLYLHFCWLKDEPEESGERAALDSRLQERYAGRVTINSSASGALDEAFVSDVFKTALLGGAAGGAVSSSEAFFSAEGLLPYKSLDYPELITLEFPQDAVPASVSFIAEMTPSLPADAAMPAAPEEAALSPAPEAAAATPAEASLDLSVLYPDATLQSEDATLQSEDAALQSEEAPLQSEEAVAPAPAAQKTLPLYAVKDSAAFWLLLPRGGVEGTFHAVYDGAAPAQSARISARVIPTQAAATSLTPAQDSVAGGATPSEPVQYTLFSDDTTWTAEVSLPGFGAGDLKPVLQAVYPTADGAMQAVPAAGADDGTGRWTMTLPKLPVGATGSLQLTYTLWDQPQGGAALTVPFTVQNRAPKLADGVASPVSVTAYCDIDGISDSEIVRTLAMGDYFLDEDGEALKFSSNETYTSTSAYEYRFEDGQIIYTPLSKSSRSFEATVKAADPQGESVECTFQFSNVSVRSAIDSLRMSVSSTALLSGNRITVPLGEQPGIEFSLAPEDVALLNDAFGSVGLPALSQCLQLTLDGSPVEITPSEDGGLCARRALPAAEASGSTLHEVSAQLTYAPPPSADGEADDPVVIDLPELLPFAQFEVAVTNTPPRLREGVETDVNAGSRDILGRPGRYAPVSLSDCFGDVVLGELFVNDESSEQLQYAVTVQGGGAELYDPASAEPGAPLQPAEESGDRKVYRLSGEIASRPLALSFLAPGAVSVVIEASDADQACEQTVTYRVKLASRFVRLAVILAVVIAVLAAAVVLLLILMQKRKPSFGNTAVLISNSRRRMYDSRDGWTTLNLEVYGKSAVSILTLLVASGQLPPRGCESDALAHIAIQPGKRGDFRVTRAGQSAASVALAIDGRRVSENAASLKSGDYLTLSTEGKGGEFLHLCIRAAD